MDQKLPSVITISRQFGSGGADIGQNLAVRLNFLYLDRDIVTQTAKKLFVSPEKLQSIDERHHRIGTIIPTLFSYTPTSQEIYETQSKIILKTVEKQSVVIVGRAGNYVLRNHPRHISIFLHADIAFRQHRIEEIYKMSPAEALKFIETTDKNRLKYVRTFTRQDITDARNYNLSIDTGVVGLDAAEEIIVSYINTRYGQGNF